MTFDAIILGLGGMGSAALDHLARRGKRVFGIEQFPLVHDRGSSHGHSRIIRTAYYEHPSYVPLVRRSFELWRQFEVTTGQRLLVPSPCLTVGPPNGELIIGVRNAAREHNLSIDELSSREIESRFPMFRIGGDYEGILERDAGVLLVEKCVRTQLDSAKARGAQVLAECPVRSWQANSNGIEVTTDRETFRASKLIITAGAWANQLLAELGLPLTVMRQTMHWFASPNRAEFEVNRFPIFLLDTPDGAFYGLPGFDDRGVKIARHYGAPELNSPSEVDWTVHDRDVLPIEQFLARHIPSARGPSTSQVCQYTLTPDRHFAIGLHPRHSNVCIAAGFSGHGFKFAPIVGEILADLVEQGQTKHDIGLFSLTRFASRSVG